MIIYTDGASRGNPGPAGAGAYVLGAGKGKKLHKFLGNVTNNVAEYEALLMAIQYALRHKEETLWLRSDSKLMVMQVNGRWAVNSPELRDRWAKAIRLLRKFKEWDLVYIPRESNWEADRAANEAIDNA